jgi:hypothetical protein
VEGLLRPDGGPAEARRRQEEKRQIAHEIAVLKAMQKAGLSIRRAVGSTGLAVELGQPVGTETTPSLTPSIPHAEPVNPWDEDLCTIPLPLRQ